MADDLKQTAPLRRISAHVDERDPGRFIWVLMEQCADATQWKEIDVAKEPYDMWLNALQAGMWALERMSNDDRIGPRAGGESEDGFPVGDAYFLR